MIIYCCPQFIDSGIAPASASSAELVRLNPHDTPTFSEDGGNLCLTEPLHFEMSVA